jgi:hypothetical protein
MLRATVSLSRKISRDFNSTGYTVSLDGEIPAQPDEPELILGKIQELFSLVGEALNLEIDRDQGDAAIGRRDEEPSVQVPAGTPTPPDRPVKAPVPTRPSQPTNNHARPGNNDQATPKQVQFINALANRQKLSHTQLESIIHDTLGRHSTLQQLTKKEAGAVIDTLNSDGVGNGQNTGGK